jgi:hypothetical protein
MSVKKTTIIDSWPALKKDLNAFLSDTDAWIIASLKEARIAKDWSRVDKIIAIMDMVHTMSHGH